MKNYLDFKLSGSRIFPYFLCIFLTYIAYMILNTYAMVNPDPISPLKFVSMGFLLVYAIVAILCMFYIYRLFIISTSYKGEALKFDGEYDKYVKLNLVGILLTIVTLGIYSCWYQKKLNDFFAQGTSYNNIKFKFNGSAIVLFAIVTVLIVLTFSLSMLFGYLAYSSPVFSILPMILIILVCVPMMYLIYRWYINLSYGNKKIKMREGGYVYGSFYFLLQIALIIITFGLYYPAAIIRIYRYFMERIEIRNEEGVLEAKMGCDAKMGQDFIFIFAQMLLTIVTLGIYLPWAGCTINERLITKTYIETITE